MKLKVAIKNLDVDTVKELEAASSDDLKQRIVSASQAIEQAERELEENEQYQELKEQLKAVTAGLKELKKRQNSIITVAVNHLNKE